MLTKVSHINYLSTLILTAFISIVSLTSYANPVIPIPTRPQAIITPTLPILNAKSYILIDANTGKILAEKNSDARLAPASLTKLMTMYVISKTIKSGSIRLEDKVHISEKAWHTDGSRMFVKVNDDVPVQELLHGIVIASGNDASVAMAEHIAGTEETFSSMMNAEAKNIGMTNSHFVDSNGLPNADHYSTAHDLALLAQAIIRDFPEDYRLYSQKWFSYNNIKQPNRNRLLWRYQFADGLKTGHTNEAGYCLVGSAVKDGTRLISVVMGEPNDSARTEDSIRLLTYGFRFFETHKLYNGNTKLAAVRVWKGQNREVELGLSKDFYLTMPSGQYKNIHALIKGQDLKAPIIKGQPYGTLTITLNDQILATESLVALKDDPKGGFFRSFSDSVHFVFHKVFSRSNDKMNNS